MVTMSMSELCRKKNAFSAQVSKGPVLITKREKTAFVAVPYEVWKTLKPRKTIAAVFTDTSTADIEFDIPRDNGRKGLRDVSS